MKGVIMSWGGSLSCGLDLSSEMEYIKCINQCPSCAYFRVGWKGVTDPSPDICVHPANKRKHNKRVKSKYYECKKCNEWIDIRE